MLPDSFPYTGRHNTASQAGIPNKQFPLRFQHLGKRGMLCYTMPGTVSYTHLTRFETRSHTGRLIMLRLYCRYFSIQLKSALEYKVSFLLTALGQFFVSFAGFLSVFFMFQQFHTVDGFTYQQVLLCFSVVLSAFSIAELFAAGFKGFSHVVSNGEFDRIMLRPAGTLFQTFASKIEFSSVGRLLQAVVILAYAIWSSGIRWTIQGAVSYTHLDVYKRQGNSFPRGPYTG